MVVLGAALAAGGLFGLFQLHLLPKAWGPWVSKIYFWPTLPFTMMRAFDNYWTKMDGEGGLGRYSWPYSVRMPEVHKVAFCADTMSPGAIERNGSVDYQGKRRK